METRMSRRKVATIVGTRPEVIKMAPVVRELERHEAIFDHTLVTTAQHREMLDQILAAFDLRPMIDLGLMEQNQGLARFASRSLEALANLFADLKPDGILIQGDTTTVMTAALAASYQDVTIGHVEAGLRSFDRRNPFPEELNRRVAGCLADLHFAPTERARVNLLREGVAAETIFVTGNTIVDALNSISLSDEFDNSRLNEILSAKRRMLLVTVHRRENHGAKLRAVCQALRTLVATVPDIEVVYPVHLNPNVRNTVQEEIGGVERIKLVDPVSYGDLVRLLKRCFLVLTDSGGIQEEAPSFRKPVLVLRDVTERPELIDANGGRVIGTDLERIVEEATRLLRDPRDYESMCVGENPFGDGHAAERIVNILAQRLK
jgi:UDP-N-acetylglucosamine 2-epimerase (non-hydrolysing)